MSAELNQDELLNVRETAKLLGIHENTVRNWVKSGALPDSRIPGSNFHRFRRADVERMRSRSVKTTTTVRKEHQTIGPELVDGTQLNIWAGTKAAQVKFPELMRRLLAATPGVQKILIRANEGVAIGGYDGSALSRGTQYLPAGDLRFEFGVDQKIKTKADKEWARHAGAKPSSAVFVFATPRRWGNAQAWATDRRAEKKFSDVWVIDADVLEGWLALTPSVHYWISEQLGRRPANAQSIERWWDQFSTTTDPQLPAALFIAGRNEQARSVQTFMSGLPGLLTIRAEWAKDAISFAYAATRATDKEPTQTTVTLVDTPEVWDRIIAQPSSSVLIPMFENANVAAAVNRGYHVIVILDQSTASTQAPDLSLGRPERIAAVEALQSVGVNFKMAQRFAGHARRNFQAFVRSISANPGYRQPAWAQPPLASSLAKLRLIGEWTTSEADIKLVEKIVGKSWQDVEQDLASVSDTDDPVFRKIGNQWSLTSPCEAFDLLSGVVKAKDLAIWSETVRACLLETDPTLDLSDEDRPLARIRGMQRQYSTVIRKGIARSAALMGARGQSISFDDGRTLAEHVQDMLGSIYTEAVTDETGRRWEELVDVLPLLAEAAPEEFFEALREDLARPYPSVLSLFQDAKEPSTLYLGPTSPHPWLLWAIETVTWSDDYFVDGIWTLTKLAALDTGGRKSNRPIDTLATVMCGRARNTSATIDQKIDALGVIQELHPDVCWDLLMRLWPSNHEFMMPPASPRIRDWQPASTSVSMADWVKFTHAIVEHAVDLAAGRAERIAQLVEGLASVPETDQARILDFLAAKSAEGSELDDDERFTLWEKLHDLVAQHERYSTAAWSFGEETIERIKSVLAVLEPSNDPKRFAYLFDWHPDLPGVDAMDITAYDALLTKLQTEAIDELVNDPDSAYALEELAKQARVPSHVGWAMARNEQIPLNLVAPWLGSDEPSLRKAGSAWFNRKVQISGANWLADALAGDLLMGDARTLAIRNVPTQRALWKVIAQRKSDDDSYWGSAHLNAFDLPPGDVMVAVNQLVAHDRAWAALEILADAIRPKSGEASPQQDVIPPDLLIHTLEQAIAEDPRPQDVSNMTSYYVGTLLDYLATSHTDESVMARFEFAFFRLLEHTRDPKVLSTELASSPGLFVDLAKRVSRGKHDPKVELSEREQQLANQAWWVLNGWKGYPGQRTDGSVDSNMVRSWVHDARLQFSESGRADIGDELIGESFAHAPVGQDGAWPAESIRDIIETIGSERLEVGFISGRRNARGVTTRGPYDGGTLERALAETYRHWSKTVKSKWPRTARMLRLIAEGYDYEARREDVRAELEGDRD